MMRILSSSLTSVSGATDSLYLNYTKYYSMEVIDSSSFYLSGVGDDIGGMFVGKYNYNLQVSIKEFNFDGFSLNLYPNPSNGTFNIIYQSKEQANFEIKVTNVLGATVHSEYISDFNGAINKTIETHLPQGTYFVTIRAKETVQSKRIVIQ